MNNTTQRTQPRHIPQTARGRALFTVGWFLTGIRPQSNLDQQNYHLTAVRHAHA